jgi:hypothetical protein
MQNNYLVPLMMAHRVSSKIASSSSVFSYDDVFGPWPMGSFCDNSPNK